MKLGLVGKNISYSFSRGYFKEKFETLALANHSYENFDLSTIEEFSEVIKLRTSGLKGVNVTIPYKQDVQPFLTEIDIVAKEIGAVNTIKFYEDGRVKGFNTDVDGFLNSIQPLLKNHHKKALILGTGGASKAVAYALRSLKIDYKFVSRTGKNSGYTYEQLTPELFADYTVVINCSPLGTFPNIENKPAIPYQAITADYLLYDLIYNPEETTFLKLGKQQGAAIKNGLEMLQLQAEKAWEIWNDKN